MAISTDKYINNNKGSRVHRDRLDTERVQYEVNGAQAQTLGPLLRVEVHARPTRMHAVSEASKIRRGLDQYGSWRGRGRSWLRRQFQSGRGQSRPPSSHYAQRDLRRQWQECQRSDCKCNIFSSSSFSYIFFATNILSSFFIEKCSKSFF